MAMSLTGLTTCSAAPIRHSRNHMKLNKIITSNRAKYSRREVNRLSTYFIIHRLSFKPYHIKYVISSQERMYAGCRIDRPIHCHYN